MPELPTGYLAPLPDDRPVGLRRRRIDAGTELWRIDATAPAEWTWEGFPNPRYRFDPEHGTFRVRYAGRSLVGAVLEKYQSVGRYIPADHANMHLVRLVADRHLSVFDLRVEQNLDVLEIDDRVSTGQHPNVWATCHRLADAALRWWDDVDAIVYRSRTTPATSSNLAFFATEQFETESWPLAKRTEVIADLVLRHGFTVGWDIPAS